jgi:hypothetical protein
LVNAFGLLSLLLFGYSDLWRARFSVVAIDGGRVTDHYTLSSRARERAFHRRRRIKWRPMLISGLKKR